MSIEKPHDFDWRFYLNSHIDLLSAGFKTEQQAVEHYTKHGYKEGRIYKDIASANVGNHNTLFHNEILNNKPIRVYIQWYSNNQRLDELTKAVVHNLENILIDEIVIFCDRADLSSLPEVIRQHQKSILVGLHGRLTYGKWMQYCLDNQYQEYIHVLCNTDIYFDKSINLLKYVKFEDNHFGVVTRQELDEKGRIVDSKDHKDGPITNPLYSHDVWIINDNKTITNCDLEVYKNIELGIENCDRVLCEKLNSSNFNIINLYPHVIAIHIDNRNIKIRPSYFLQSKENTEVTNIKQINDFLKIGDCEYRPQRLEALVVLCTGNEIESGDLSIFLNMLINNVRNSNSKSQKICSALDLVISVSKNRYVDIDSELYETLSGTFKTVILKPIEIDPTLDVYYNHISQLSGYAIPEYGIKSGPNVSFFKTISCLTKYNTCLVLETDTILNDNLIDVIYHYVKYNSFLIAGTTYGGRIFDKHINLSHNIMRHLNGGVCLYHTSSRALQNFMMFAYKFMPHYLKASQKYNEAYDVYIYMLIHIGFSERSESDIDIWLYLYRNYIQCNWLCNYSESFRLHPEINDINKRNHPYVIHIKNSI